MPLPDYLATALKIIFVGYNPGETSELLQHHFAGRGNQFWRLLADSGLTNRLYTAAEDGLLLHEGYGLTNLVARPSKSSADLTREEMRQGAVELRARIKQYQPEIVCFQGKEIYRAYAGLSSNAKVEYGLVVCDDVVTSDSNTSTIKEFVAPNPSGRSTIPYAEKLAIFQQLKNLSDHED